MKDRFEAAKKRMRGARHDARVAVITGASAGVGRATVRAFADAGYRIGLIARGEDGLEAAEREVEERGSEAIVLPLDVADAEAVEQAAGVVEDRFGPIDVWVNDAMVTVMSPVKRMTADEYRRVTEVDYLGYVHGTLSALRRMLPRDKGKIVQVSSALAFRSIPLQSAYCASKHAIVGFTESLRTELLHDGSGVQVSMVHMPALNTPQFSWSRTRVDEQPQPVPPIFQPEVAAEAIFYAAHSARRDVTVGGSALKTIAAEKISPGGADWYLAETGYESQLTDEDIDPDRPDNLYEPLPGDHGAHGIFDDRAKRRSWLLEANMNLGKLLLAAGALAVGGAVVASALRKRADQDEDGRPLPSRHPRVEAG